MYRRFLTLALALAIAVSGFQPSYGMTDQASVAAMEIAAGEGDCLKPMTDDCCDQTDKAKRLCQWSDACAARCHINAGLEASVFAPLAAGIFHHTSVFPEAASFHAVRAGPLFRPPII